MNRCQHCGKEHPPAAPACPVTGEAMATPGLLGSQVDRYRVEQLLGVGGFGAVYRARHVHTGVTVALKVLRRHLSMDVSTIERFLQEARAAGIVGSDHIVKVLDAMPPPQAFLAMEYLEGWDLKELATREGPLPTMRLVLIALQVLEGLGAAHAKGIVHRDMKPANVFVVRKTDDRGVERDFVKLLDFGISKMHGDDLQSGLTQTGVAMGTPSYMAPEQFFDARNVDGRADLYSVAVMLYELLSGRLPFDAQSYADLIVKIRTEQPPFLQQIAPAVPIELAQVVMVGLARDKEQRWPNALEFAGALRSALSLPARGQTPAFTTPPRPIAGSPPLGTDSPSMMMGKTATPSPAMVPGVAPSPRAPATPGASAQPAAVVSAAAPQATALPPGWVVPGASTPQAPPASAPSPAPGTPALMAAPPGSGVRGGAPGATPAAALTPGPTSKSGGLKWALIIFGVLAVAGGCCTCGLLIKNSQPRPQYYSP